MERKETVRFFEISKDLMYILKNLSYNDFLPFYRDRLKNNSPEYVINIWKDKIKPKGVAHVIAIVSKEP